MERRDDKGEVIVPGKPYIRNGVRWVMNDNEEVFKVKDELALQGAASQGSMSMATSAEGAGSALEPAKMEITISGDAAHLANIPAMFGFGAMQNYQPQQPPYIPAMTTPNRYENLDNTDKLLNGAGFIATTPLPQQSPIRDFDAVRTQPINVIQPEATSRVVRKPEVVEPPKKGKKVPSLGVVAAGVSVALVFGGGGLLQAAYDGPLNAAICSAHGLAGEFENILCLPQHGMGEVLDAGNMFQYFPKSQTPTKAELK